ncbi:unnamed protein product [Plutella xylostella]|uniref:(diamondback moth) hypothetical protein n=1 Tax=Plutella xylostella TaxID=51655 RepID=A0A8S4G325_PLUXY|nr:unnamed protein product [Plutella xylostella]
MDKDKDNNYVISSRLWVEVVRLVRLRYEQRHLPAVEVPLQDLHRGEVPSVEMRNHLY